MAPSATALPGALYAQERFAERPDERPDLRALRRELTRIRRNGFVLNQGRSERGVVAVGVTVRGDDGEPVAGLSVSMPAVRYERARLSDLVATLNVAAMALARDLVTEADAGGTV